MTTYFSQKSVRYVTYVPLIFHPGIWNLSFPVLLPPGLPSSLPSFLPACIPEVIAEFRVTRLMVLPQPWAQCTPAQECDGREGGK